MGSKDDDKVAICPYCGSDKLTAIDWGFADWNVKPAVTISAHQVIDIILSQRVMLMVGAMEMMPVQILLKTPY
jgi:hypothetical protein